METAIVAHAVENPTHGAQRTAAELLRSGGVRGGWSRLGLTTKHGHLLRLKEMAKKRRLKLSEQQFRALERFDPELAS